MHRQLMSSNVKTFVSQVKDLTHEYRGPLLTLDSLSPFLLRATAGQRSVSARNSKGDSRKRGINCRKYGRELSQGDSYYFFHFLCLIPFRFTEIFEFLVPYVQ